MKNKNAKALKILSDVVLSDVREATLVADKVVAVPTVPSVPPPARRRGFAAAAVPPAAGPAMVSTAALAEASGKRLMVATARAFNAKAAPVTIALSDDGSVQSIFELAEDNFQLGMLFKNFRIPGADLFVFDDVKVVLDRKGKKSSIDFNGLLRMNSAALSPFKSFANLGEGLLMSGEIELAQGESIAGKLPMTAFKLTSAAQFHVAVSNDVVFNGLEFAIEVSKKASGTGFELEAALKGELVLGPLIADPAAKPLKCAISLEDGTLKVTASTEEAAITVAGLRVVLNDALVEFEAGNSKSIQIGAKLAAGSKTFELAGVIRPDFFGVFAAAKTFSLGDLGAVFESATGLQLGLPDFPLNFDSVSLGVASTDGKVGDHDLQQGVTLAGTITAHDHTFTATALLQSHGVSLSGSVDKLEVGPVTITNAKLAVEIFSKASGKGASFSVSGSATIQGVTVDCKLVYERSGNSGFNAIVYAGMDASTFGLSRAIPQVKGSFVDELRFSKVAFIVAAKAAKLKDPDFGFEVKKGVQLIGELRGIPGLEQLTGKKANGLILSAEFGSKLAIGIAMPQSTRLELGGGVSCDPFKIRIELIPPELQLIFGMKVIVPKQVDPLQFDLMVAIGAIEASGSGTMKGFWEEPFGLKKLRIGPALALEIGINYTQFASTGTPSKLAFAGGLQMGTTVASMAVSVSTNPMENILFGKVEDLSPANLIAFIKDVTGAEISPAAVPNFFQLKLLEIYVAPAGGSIGTITYDPGFSFTCDLVLFGKSAFAHFSLGDAGMKAKAELDKIEIGPLKIGGKRGQNMLIDVELTAARQALTIDAEIDFAGSSTGLFVDISNKGIEFDFEQKFMGALTFRIRGISSGSIQNPESLDFLLTAEFDNQLTEFLRTTVTRHITVAIQTTGADISRLQQVVEEAKVQFLSEFEPAEKNLRDAKLKADQELAILRANVNREKLSFDNQLNAALAQVARAKGAYDSALAGAQAALDRAQGDFDSAVQGAQQQVDRAKADYDNAMRAAQAEVQRTEAVFNQEVARATGQLKAAETEVNKLNAKIADIERDIRNTGRFNFPKKAALETAKQAVILARNSANLFLRGVRETVSGVSRGAGFVAFESAKATLNTVRTGVKFAAFDSAQQALETTRRGSKSIALEAARRTLTLVQNGTEFAVWQSSEQALKTVQSTGRGALDLASQGLASFGSSAINLSFQAAEAALEGVKKGAASAAFEAAKIALEGARQGSEAMLGLARAVTANAGSVIDVKHVKLTSRLTEIQQGELFDADIDMSILGNPQNIKLKLDVSKAGDFVEQMFKETLGEAKKIIS